MAISDKDRVFWDEVAAYFRTTKTPSEPEGSIRDTAIHFDVNRNKVRKILITLGEITSPITLKAKGLKEQGLTVQEMADRLGVSTATVSMYLPYDEKVKDTLDPSKHTQAVRDYRAEQKRVRTQQEATRAGQLPGSMLHQDTQQVEIPSWTDALAGCDGMEKGSLYSRPLQALNHLQEVPEDPAHVLRVHLSLPQVEKAFEENPRLKRQAMVRGSTMSRDLVLPAEMPLHALHSVIQRAFGWDGGSAHAFVLPSAREADFLGERHPADQWKALIGYLYRSPLMSRADRLWTDDYIGGSVKKWLRSKYTGPYVYTCPGEDSTACRRGLRGLDPGAFETRMLLERLPLLWVLAPGISCLPEQTNTHKPPKGSCLSASELRRHIWEKRETEDRMFPRAVTESLIYRYGKWEVTVTASLDCKDLMSAITQTRLDRANLQCRTTWRPVLLLQDGMMVGEETDGPEALMHQFMEKTMGGVLEGEGRQETDKIKIPSLCFF